MLGSGQGPSLGIYPNFCPNNLEIRKKNLIELRTPLSFMKWHILLKFIIRWKEQILISLSIFSFLGPLFWAWRLRILVDLTIRFGFTCPIHWKIIFFYKKYHSFKFTWILATWAVLGVLLILWVEIVNGICHYVSRIHGFLKIQSNSFDYF